MFIDVSIYGYDAMQENKFERVAKALADPRRAEILEVISREGEISCGVIAERFPVGQSTISHHLRMLVDAGLVKVRRDGQHGYFSPCPGAVESYMKGLSVRFLYGRQNSDKGG